MSTTELPGDDVRTMLRDSLRGFLGAQWKPEAAAKAARSADEIASIWIRLVGQGVAALGCDLREGGLREILVVMTELGRAACPAPMWSAALANLALSDCRAEAAVELLEKLHNGTASVAFSFGALDPDVNTGSIQLADGRAGGLLRFVETAGSCTHLVVAVDASGVAIVVLNGPGVELEATRAMGAWGLYQVRLKEAAAIRIDLASAALDDLLLAAKLALLGRAYGAARAAFELTIDHAKERKQFGQPIGRFQAIQHKLANCLIALEGVRLTLDHAANLHDRGDKDWRYFVNSAAAFGCDALRRVSLETQHTLGAIGYAEEHQAPSHFKRVHLDTVALGGATEARRRVGVAPVRPRGRRSAAI